MTIEEVFILYELSQIVVGSSHKTAFRKKKREFNKLYSHVVRAICEEKKITPKDFLSLSRRTVLESNDVKFAVKSLEHWLRNEVDQKT